MKLKRCPRCGFDLPQGRQKLRKLKTTYFRKGHEYLSGVLAHTKRRLEIFRNAGGEAAWFNEADPGSVEEIKPAMCQGCVEPHEIYWSTFHWHHNVKSHGGKRCDCAACALAVCEPWHTHYHNRIIAVKQRQAQWDIGHPGGLGDA